MDSESRVSLLVVEDDGDLRETTAEWFAGKGYDVTAAGSAEEALSLCGRRALDIGILDMWMPGMSGLELLRRLKEFCSDTEILVLTGEATIEMVVEAMKLSAYDYLVKPCPLDELERRCRKAHEAGRLRRENRRLRALVERFQPPEGMIGRSPAMREVLRVIERAAPTDTTVLIQGESGTGKELVARALHRQSRRSEQPLVVINCAALPEQLLESELFGHERGAFTGAVAAKPGLFEIADRGTLFVDEVGELASALQAKLLRVLEDGSFRRVGSLQERRADVRLVAATNRDLMAEVRAKRFREDLYYRLNALQLDLPPLRRRDGDLPLLVEAFLGEGWEVEPQARQALEQYDWPGNVRQLINALQRAKILADDGVIRLHDLPLDIATVASASAPDAAPVSEVRRDDLAGVERVHVLDVLRREGGNKARAARALGITRRSLYRLLDRFGLTGLPK